MHTAFFLVGVGWGTVVQQEKKKDSRIERCYEVHKHPFLFQPSFNVSENR